MAALLRGFLEDHKADRHEASILSLDTVLGIQDGDDDVWNDLKTSWKMPASLKSNSLRTSNSSLNG